MKIRHLIFFALLAITSCQSRNETANNQDCSAVFASPSENLLFNNASQQCKVLPLQISTNIKCEISASNKVDNLLNSYAQNQGDKIFFMAPLDVLQDLGSDISLKDKIKYFFLIQKIKDHIDSGIFQAFADYHYKGMNCVVDGNKFTGWISKKEVIVIYEGSKKAAVVESKSVKKSAKKHKK